METEKLERNWLQDLYLEDLTKSVNYGGGDRSRVANPEKWKTVVDRYDYVNTHNRELLLESEQNIWMWSDLHFFHKNIINFSDRPYPDVPTMNEHLVTNFNETVGPNDISIWGGDIGFKGDKEVNNLLDQCNGYKILIIGNHDFNGKKLRKMNFNEVHLSYLINTPDVALFFTHYPMYNIPYPYVNIHGHLHAYPTPISNHDRHININCEVQDYKPIHLNDVIKKAKMRLMVAEK